STGTVKQRRAILTHELAHVLRWDAAVNHLQNIVQAVFFFHPLIWWTNQKIRQEREKCCDEIVLSASDTQPRVYCEAIVEMLANEYTSRQSTPALAVTGSVENVKERITTMLTPNRKFLRRPSRAAVVSMLLVAAFVLPTAFVVTPQIGNATAQDESTRPDAVADSKDTKPAISSTWVAGQTMSFRVINADTKEPIPDVTLELQNMGRGIDSEDVKIEKTDDEGRSSIPLPDLPPTMVRVYLIKDGFVPLRVGWFATPHPTIPASITIPIEPGKKFGGEVRNEAGEPIPDVNVTIKYWAEGKGESPNVGVRIDATTITNKEGQWRLNNMPAEFDNENDLRIYLHHPDYASDPIQLSSSPSPVTERPTLT
ncbi:MAG TPA: M56 family metallopeptidase, partial [Pirellulaceae bacterium]|nr:M56 family metallopeptidase [Pirellulaceae bacterium]